MSLILQNMRKLPNAPHDSLPTPRQLDPSKLATPLHQRPEVFLRGIEILVSPRGDDGVCYFLMDVFPASDEFGVLFGW